MAALLFIGIAIFYKALREAMHGEDQFLRLAVHFTVRPDDGSYRLDPARMIMILLNPHYFGLPFHGLEGLFHSIVDGRGRTC